MRAAVKTILLSVALLAAALPLGVLTADPAAAASSITAPTGSPYLVPADGTGTPASFTIAYAGFPAASQVYVEQCDGVAASTPGWNPLAHCDLGTSPSAVSTAANGTGSFPADDPNFGFVPFRGPSPQGQFNCLSPLMADPANGLASSRTCQIRLSTNNTVVTADQVFLSIQLPEPASAPTTPGPPTEVTATAGDGQATVSWTPPASTGGKPITGYVITPRIGATAQPTVTVGAAATTKVITGLTNGTAYTFTVAAVNQIGTGAASAPSSAVTPSAPAPPHAPTNVVAVAGDGQATVSWTPPSNVGTAPLSGYVITPYLGATAQPTVSVGAGVTTKVVTGLTNGTAYTFTVTAVNAVGSSPPSAPSSAVSPKPPTGPVPTQPVGVAAVGGSARVTLTWTPGPAVTGAVTGWVITPLVKGVAQPSRSVTGPAPTATVTGLTNGVVYTFTVAGVNPSGTGVASVPSNAVTPRSQSWNDAFVTAAYEDFLGRVPTAAERSDAAVALNLSKLDRRPFVTNLASSPGWVASVVDRLYRDTLGRPGDRAGLDHWTVRIRSGKATVAQVAAAFYASPEYYRGLGGNTPASWIADLYRKLLGRPADAAGSAYWTAQVAATSRTSVALRFYQSGESAAARVDGLFVRLLGRHADAAGKAYWAGRVVVVGDLALATDLAVSQEYFDRAQVRFP